MTVSKRGFRHLLSHLLPGWMVDDSQGGDGGKVTFSLALMIDIAREAARQRLNARFPSRTPSAGLALIGQERGILRGRNEGTDAYARRLKAWRGRTGHRTRGNPFALLRQIWAYFGGAVVSETIDRRGNRFQIAADATGTEAYTLNWYEFEGGSFLWDDAPATPRWARFWTVLYVDGLFTENAWDAGLWGGTFGDPDYTLGQNGATQADVSAITGLFKGSRAWKPAGTRCEWIVVRLDGTTPPIPDGTWGPWGKLDGVNYTRTRPSEFRYWSVYGYEYAGNPDNFPATCDDVEGNTGGFVGDPESFPASAVLPGGDVYAGNPDNFPTSATLPDDGS